MQLQNNVYFLTLYMDSEHSALSSQVPGILHNEAIKGQEF